MRYADLKNCNRVVVSNHALHRWNTRVGPVFESIGPLEQLFTKLLRETDRLEIAGRDCICVDNDIIAACSFKKGTLFIDSFLGRISMRPALGNFNALSGFMMREGTRSDKRYSDVVKTMGREGINLSLTPQELSRMVAPRVSNHVTVVKVLSNMFKLTIWEDSIQVKQLTGNVGVGQEIIVAKDKIHDIWTLVQPNSLSHIHLAELSAKILDFMEESEQNGCTEDSSVV